MNNRTGTHRDFASGLSSPVANRIGTGLGVCNTPSVRPDAITGQPDSDSSAEVSRCEVSRCGPAPVVPGDEHFSIWLKEPGQPAPRFIKAWTNEAWPEFVEGFHYDVRQPSRLTGLCGPHKPPNAKP